jgi:hypothetical protein
MPQVNGQDGISRDQGPKNVKHGVWGQSDTGYGVVGTTDAVNNAAIAGYGSANGVYGQAYNKSLSAAGVSGEAQGVYGDGVRGIGKRAGVRGYNYGEFLLPGRGVDVTAGVVGEGLGALSLANLQVVIILHILAYAWCEGQCNIS